MARMVGSPEYMATEYVDYQKKYRAHIRESDKVTLSLIERFMPERAGKALLDVGCHNGNMLYHIKTSLPGFILKGIDIFPEVIQACRQDKDLDEIEFSVMDVLNIDIDPVDVIVASAVLSRFSDQEHEKIWHLFFSMLNPGGCVISFEWYNPFRQTLRIVEETDAHPDGLILNFRSQNYVEKLLGGIGFQEKKFTMFEIPIDLNVGDRQSPLHTYTEQLIDGRRLQFRGSLYQPWCHLVAQKSC